MMGHRVDYARGADLDAVGRGWALRGDGEPDHSYRIRLKALMRSVKPPKPVKGEQELTLLGNLTEAAAGANRMGVWVKGELAFIGASGVVRNRAAWDELQKAERQLYGAIWAIREIKRL